LDEIGSISLEGIESGEEETIPWSGTDENMIQLNRRQQ